MSLLLLDSSVQSGHVHIVLQCTVICPYVQVQIVHRVCLLNKTGHSVISGNVLRCTEMCPYVQVHNGEHSLTVVHRVGLFMTCSQV